MIALINGDAHEGHPTEPSRDRRGLHPERGGRGAPGRAIRRSTATTSRWQRRSRRCSSLALPSWRSLPRIASARQPAGSLMTETIIAWSRGDPAKAAVQRGAIVRAVVNLSAAWAAHHRECFTLVGGSLAAIVQREWRCATPAGTSFALEVGGDGKGASVPERNPVSHAPTGPKIRVDRQRQDSEIAECHDRGGSLRPRADAELAFDALDVEMNRGRRNAEDLSDIGVGFSFQHPPQAFDLAW